MESTSVVVLCLVVCCFVSQLGFVSAKQKSAGEYHWPYPELNKNVEEYQDAWKFISQNITMYLKYRSYDKESPSSKGDVKCIKFSLLSKNQEEGFVVTKMEFYDTYSSQMTKVETRLTTKKSKGYKVANLLVPDHGPQAGPAGRPNVVFPLAFTDYETCAILRVPQKDGCQLWVRKESLHSLEGYCHFIYNVLCGKRKYDVYSDQLCGYLERRQEKTEL